MELKRNPDDHAVTDSRGTNDNLLHQPTVKTVGFAYNGGYGENRFNGFEILKPLKRFPTPSLSLACRE